MAMKASHRLSAAMPWLDGVGEGIRKIWEPLLGQDAPRAPRDLLYGTWLGHPLHPAIVTMPIGFWTSALVLDLVGEERAADLSVKLGVVTAVGAAATGAAQWQDVAGEEKARRLGALHAVLNTGATGLYGASWLLRARGARGAGIACSTAGFAIANVSAWIGGDLSYDLGIGVNHTAFEEPPTEWTDVAAETDLTENKPLRVDAGDAPVMLVRQGEEIFAIAAVCTHVGGPLDEGKIEGENVICPWHGSVFCLRDGKVLHGPATAPQRAYEVRRQDGRVAVRPID